MEHHFGHAAGEIHANGGMAHRTVRQCVDQSLDEVEPHGPDPGPVHRLELGIRYVATDHSDAALQAARCLQRVDQRTIVGAVTGSLNDDVTLETEMRAQRPQRFLRRVTGRVLA